MEVQKIVNQIMAVILEEINGYSREEAIKHAHNNIGHPVYERIESIIDKLLPVLNVEHSFLSGQKIKVELEDGTVWNAEVSEQKTVIIDCTHEYISYYEWKYGGGNEYPTPISNEYRFEEVKVLKLIKK